MRSTLLICLAPELDLAYEQIYAYLQDDLTKKRPSIDLVLNLLCPSFEAKLSARCHFSHAAPLVRYRLLIPCDDPAQPQSPLLARSLKLDERIVAYLLGDDQFDSRLLPFIHQLSLELSPGQEGMTDKHARHLAVSGQQ